MKAAAAVLGVLVVVAAGWMVVPLLLRHPPRAGATGPTGPMAAPPARSRPLEAPRTREEEIRRRFTQEREPFFRFLRERCPSTVSAFEEGEQIDTLDLTLAGEGADVLQAVMDQVVIPYGREYGFRHVRFFVPSPPGSPDPRKLIAEASCSDDGKWALFPR